jgi:hypothetical protein
MHAMSLPELMLFAFHLSNMGYGIVSRCGKGSAETV